MIRCPPHEKRTHTPHLTCSHPRTPALPPSPPHTQEAHLLLPSLHIMGCRDFVYTRSVDLTNYYDASMRVVLEHGEGHNIPSMRSGLYPIISEWVNKLP
jgi:hypothetical protein